MNSVPSKIDQLGPHAEEIAMTIAEQLHEEGREQGLAQGLAQGREQGLAQGLAQGRIAALRALLTFKFGSQALDASYEARLHAATSAVIDQYLQRALTADSVAAVFED